MLLLAKTHVYRLAQHAKCEALSGLSSGLLSRIRQEQLIYRLLRLLSISCLLLVRHQVHVAVCTAVCLDALSAPFDADVETSLLGSQIE